MKGKNQKLQYLDDSEITLEESNDLLGTGLYIEVLSNTLEAISENQNAETIAISGKWGSGKSSIIKGLQKKIQLDGTRLNNRKIKFHYYDAWKYSNDSFRKTFLINCTDSDKVKKTLEKELYQKTNVTELAINNKPWWILVSLVFMIAVMYFIYHFSKQAQDAPQFYLALVHSTVSGVVITWVFKTLLNSIISEKRISNTKEFSPQDFSDKFHDIVKSKKIFSVYVIDDIDRCTNNQILEILETIHGFLKAGETGSYNYVFIVPIDRDRIYKVLKSERQFDVSSCDEYFNKLFDVIINIDLPERQNLFQMIDSLNNKYGFGFSSLSISLLSDYLVNTPREIKRSINEINLYRMIIEKKKEKGYISESLLNNLDQLVKLFILKKKWKVTYNALLDNAIKGVKIDDFLNSQLKLESDDISNFVRDSMSVSIRDIRAFEYLKDTELEINEADVSLIIGGDTEQLNKRLKEGVRIESLIEHYLHAYRKYIVERDLTNTYAMTLLNSYVWILTQTDEFTENELESSISHKVILSLVNQYYKICTQLPEKYEFSLPSLEIRDLISNKRESEITTVILDEYISYLIILEDYGVIYSLLEIDKEFVYLNDFKREELLDLLIVNWKPHYDRKLSELIDETNLFDEVFKPDRIATFVDDDARSLIVKAFQKNPFLISDSYDQIIEKSEISAYFNLEYDFEELYGVLSYLLCISSKNLYESLNDQLENTNISSFINSIRLEADDDELDMVVGTLLDLFFNKYASAHVKTKEAQIQLFNRLAQSPYFVQKLYPTIELSDLNNEIKFEYIFNLLITRDYNIEVVKLLVRFINQLNDKEMIEKVLSVLNQVYHSSSSFTLPLDYLNKSISIYKQKYLQVMFPETINLRDDLFIKLIRLTDLETVINTPKVFEFVKDKKEGNQKNVELYGELVQKISTVSEYISLSFINRNTHKSKLSKAMDNVLEKVNNVNQLLDLHNLNVITDWELNKIKRKKIEAYPNSSTQLFTKIVWDEDEKRD